MQEAHISKLKEGVDAGGDASLQNGLDMAVASLKSVPPYGHREVCPLEYKMMAVALLTSPSWLLLMWGYRRPVHLISGF